MTGSPLPVKVAAFLIKLPIIKIICVYGRFVVPLHSQT